MNGNKKRRQEGSTLIMVLCVLMITEVLSLSLHFAAAALTASAEKAKQKSQCRIMAVSCLGCLENELLDSSCTLVSDRNRADNSLCGYLETNKEGWEGKRTFQAGLPGVEWPEEAGKLNICLFWEKLPDNVEEEAVLCVEITASCKSQSFSIRQSYYRKQESGLVTWQR